MERKTVATEMFRDKKVERSQLASAQTASCSRVKKRTSPSAGGVLVSVWLPHDTKVEFEALAKRRGVSQSKLLRKLITTVLEENSSSQTRVLSTDHKSGVPIVLEMPRDERYAIRERAALQNLSAPPYIRALIHAHLNAQPVSFKQEFEVLQMALRELKPVKHTLDHLMQSALAGVSWAEGLRKELSMLLTLFRSISNSIRELKRIDQPME